jgi:hypothetical protein
MRTLVTLTPQSAVAAALSERMEVAIRHAGNIEDTCRD